MTQKTAIPKPTCPYCSREFRGQGALDSHLQGPPGKPDKAWHKREQAKGAAETLLATPKDKTLGNSLQAIKESMIDEEQRREAAKLVKKLPPIGSLPISPYRARITWDISGRTDGEAREATMLVLKDLRKAYPKAKIDLESIVPLF